MTLWLNKIIVHLLCYAMLCYAMLSHFSRVRLCVTPRWQPTRLPRPWDSPGKNTGVGCHFLLQCMKVKRESEVAQSCLTLSNPMDCSPPGSSVHGIFQARVLEWGAIAFSVVIEYLNYLKPNTSNAQAFKEICEHFPTIMQESTDTCAFGKCIGFVSKV